MLLWWRWFIMKNKGSQLIHETLEDSYSSPERARPAEKQLGLGTRNLLVEKVSNKNNNKQNT
jgi:hypothetical protein